MAKLDLLRKSRKSRTCWRRRQVIRLRTSAPSLRQRLPDSRPAGQSRSLWHTSRTMTPWFTHLRTNISLVTNCCDTPRQQYKTSLFYGNVASEVFSWATWIHGVALISVFVVVSHTPAYTVRSPVRDYYIAW